MSIIITKADGSQEPFKVEKLRRSLRRAGANASEINEIITDVEHKLYDGIRTQEIYREAFALLRQSRSDVAARYSLRRALFGLGPTGFPFEQFLARVFESQGYTAKVGVTIAGKCADHEIDIAAYKENHSFIGEAKFHARPGIKSDLQVAMYSYARLLDLQGAKICHEDVCGIAEFWLITNTKFTSAARRYGECVGLKMLSWDHPKRNNLHDIIEAAGVFPVTILQSISASQIETLIARGHILCSDVLQNQSVLRHLHLSQSKHERLINEITNICQHGTSRQKPL